MDFLFLPASKDVRKKAVDNSLNGTIVSFFYENSKQAAPVIVQIFLFSLSVLSGSDEVWIPAIVRFIRGFPVFVPASKDVMKKAVDNSINRYFNEKSGDIVKLKTPKVMGYLYNPWKYKKATEPLSANQRNAIQNGVSLLG